MAYESGDIEIESSHMVEAKLTKRRSATSLQSYPLHVGESEFRRSANRLEESNRAQYHDERALWLENEDKRLLRGPYDGALCR